MFEIRQDDLFDSKADAIVNTVNCVGVMGRGIALQFKQHYPENFKFYASACKRQEVVPGKMLVYDTGSMLAPRYIINFPTKRVLNSKAYVNFLKFSPDTSLKRRFDCATRRIPFPFLTLK